jgi:hypothetical protein
MAAEGAPRIGGIVGGVPLAEIKQTAGSHSAKGNPAGDAETLR